MQDVFYSSRMAAYFTRFIGGTGTKDTMYKMISDTLTVLQAEGENGGSLQEMRESGGW